MSDVTVADVIAYQVIGWLLREGLCPKRARGLAALVLGELIDGPPPVALYIVGFAADDGSPHSTVTRDKPPRSRPHFALDVASMRAAARLSFAPAKA